MKKTLIIVFLLCSSVIAGSSGQSLSRAIFPEESRRRFLPDRMGVTSEPNFAGLTLSNLTANRLIASDSNKALESVADLTAWVAGTVNRVTVTDDADGTLTLSGPQDIHALANPTFAGLTLTNGLFTFAPDTVDTDIVFTFTGTTNSGVFSWMEDEDYFRFDDTVSMNGNRLDELSDLNFVSATELTISSGAVTATIGHHNIDNEADAVNDDLDTINGGESGDILLILPNHDDRTVRIRNGVGNIFLKHQTDSSPLSFSSPSGAGAATRYAGGGWYDFISTDSNLDQAGTTQTFGTANVSYAAHASLIAGGAGTATGGSGVITIVVSGTSIDDEANRATSDTETIVSDITAMSTDDYFETTKKWIGIITYTLTVGATGHTAYAADFNYGLSKYEDFANQEFTVTGIQVAGEAGGSDSSFNMILFHHSVADWTYAATGFVPGGTQLANMNTDHVTEVDLVNSEPFAWKRTDLNTDIAGDNGEGLVFRIDTTSARSVESMSGIIWVHTAPAFSYLSNTKQHLVFMKHGPNWLEL